ncbi:hypothetical protein DL771_002831 [Monosporascus sp. 5C6A]|nr:hypothetical protein DL771_002831 [Monosporascus sp. 5C6A]
MPAVAQRGLRRPVIINPSPLLAHVALLILRLPLLEQLAAISSASRSASSRPPFCSPAICRLIGLGSGRCSTEAASSSSSASDSSCRCWTNSENRRVPNKGGREVPHMARLAGSLAAGVLDGQPEVVVIVFALLIRLGRLLRFRGGRAFLSGMDSAGAGFFSSFAAAAAVAGAGFFGLEVAPPSLASLEKLDDADSAVGLLEVVVEAGRMEDLAVGVEDEHVLSVLGTPRLGT